jgi:cobalt-precorrin-5B (C1)-methyltransferase
MRILRHGYTTGACAAAAALGATRMLREQRRVESVELFLPAGFAASFPLHGQDFAAQTARCFVVKDAGDDPDVTDGVEVHAEVAWNDSPSPQPSPTWGEGEKFGIPAIGRITPPPFMGGGRGEGAANITISGGAGIGRVTKPGLAVAVGEWAINPVPRRMILAAVRSIFPELLAGTGLRVTISIPDGAARAKRTLNERLGIVGGLSVLGTTGVVRPVSHQAWTDTLDVALDVALAADLERVVLSTGRSSEAAARRELSLPAEAFIMMGDFVGYALHACHRRGFRRLVLAAQFAKLVKIAAGHERTHVRDSRLELDRLAAWGKEAGLDAAAVKQIESANTARQAFESGAGREILAAAVADRALATISRRVPGAAVALLLAGYDGRPAVRYGDWSESGFEGGQR